MVRSNTSRTNYLQISSSLGQIYLRGKIFSNLVYLIKYQSRVGVTGRAQCHVTTAESAAPGMEAIFDRKCPPYSQTTLISSHIQYDVHILSGCVSPQDGNSTNSFEHLVKVDLTVVFYESLPHSTIGPATQYYCIQVCSCWHRYSFLSSLSYHDQVFTSDLAHSCTLFHMLVIVIL